ncbi:trafficking protein particle complex subunit 10, partial [Lecanoromycetidae sp. Uapishka_2]
MQRNLPGWNFNTFFILKEGLARGFESVGLIEDALTGYHELAFGLKAVVDEERNRDNPEQRTAHFSDYTEELYEAFKQATRKVESSSNAAEDIERQNLDLGGSILDIDRKAFQYLILTNKISIFDFQCYVFARQASLTLRLANATVTQYESTKAKSPSYVGNANGAHFKDETDLAKPNDTGPEDLLMLAEITTSAAEFLTATAHTIREDIKTAIRKVDNASMERNFNPTEEAIIHDIVNDWEFSASQRILEATSARSLSAQLEPLLRQLRSESTNGYASTDDVDPHTINTVHRTGLPSRTSSLISQGTHKPASFAQESFPLVTSLDAIRLLPPGTSRAGAQEVASQRGDLLALARRVLSSLGLRHGGWPVGLADGVLRNDDMQDIELNGDSVHDQTETQKAPTSPQSPVTGGIRNEMLLSALRSSSDFYALYEELTTSALACYVVGDRKKAAEGMTADLAVNRFQLKDYNVAASYFRQLAPFYAKDHWSNLEIVMLDMYAQCLGHLGKVEEYVRIALRTLAKIIHSTSGASKQLRIGVKRGAGTLQPISNTKVDIREIIAASQPLTQAVLVPLDHYFNDIHLDKYIGQSPQHDGFVVSLRMQSLLPGSFEATSVKVKMLAIGEEQRSELWLSTDGTRSIKTGMVNIKLNSNMMLPGWYTLGSIAIQSSNIIFTLDLSPAYHATILTRPRDSMISRQQTLIGHHRLLIWPKPSSLEVRVTHYESVNLEQPKSIKVEIVSGSNAISQGLLLLRAATAGLRLHTAEAVVQAGDVTIVDKTHPGVIGFGDLSAASRVCIAMPYDLENDLREITVRAEVKYITPKGDFTSVCNATISVLLPLAINVQDIFKDDMLFAKFTIVTASSVPVRVASCHLDGNDEYSADSYHLTDIQCDVFASQPLSLISKIRRNSGKNHLPDAGKSTQTKLYLHIDYRCLDEEIRVHVVEVFSTALSATNFGNYGRLLKPKLLATLRTRLLTQDLEATAVRREIDLGNFEDYAWATILAGLPAEQREELTKWLRSWHEDHKMVLLPDGNATDLPMQHLTVPVEVPQMHIIHNARLRSLIVVESDTSEPTTLSVGQALPMELVISHNRQWGGDSHPSVDSEVLDFVYEVQASPDVWLIGGQKKAHFSAKEDETRTFSLLLYPQTTGHLMYPTIEINFVPSDSNMLSETNDASQAESVLVVPDRISSTISLDPSGAGAGWLVESRSRNP